MVVPLASSTRPLTTAAGFWHMMGTHEGGGPVQYPDLSIYYFSIYICPTSFNTLASVIARENISFITEHNHGLSIPKCVHLTHSVDSSICRWLGTTAVHCWKKLKLDIFNGQFCLAHRHSWEGDGQCSSDHCDMIPPCLQPESAPCHKDTPLGWHWPLQTCALIFMWIIPQQDKNVNRGNGMHPC